MVCQSNAFFFFFQESFDILDSLCELIGTDVMSPFFLVFSGFFFLVRDAKHLLTRCVYTQWHSHLFNIDNGYHVIDHSYEKNKKMKKI